MPLDRLEAAFGHLWCEDLQRLGVGKAASQGFGKQTGIDAGLLGKRHYFGNHQGIAGHDHLVAGLGHLPCPHWPHVGDPLTEGQQHRAHTLKVRGIATDHDRQTARFGARRTA
ncbi:hypothetical protein D3C84_1064610 [compost metagenome]